MLSSCLLLAFFCLSLFLTHSLDFLSSSSCFLLLFLGTFFSVLFFPLPCWLAILPCNVCSLLISPFPSVPSAISLPVLYLWSEAVQLGGQQAANRFAVLLHRRPPLLGLLLGSTSAAGSLLTGSATHPHHRSAVVPCGVVTRGERSWVLVSLQGKSPLARLPAASAIAGNGVGAHEISLLYSFK